MSLKEELESAKVTHLDLSRYSRVPSGTTVRRALDQMRRERSRTALILRGDELAGIFTERDVLRRVALHPETLDGPVDDVMTADVVVVRPETSAADALWLMDEHHFRNLPVIDPDGRVVGDMTHVAVIKYLAERYPVEVLNRPPQAEQYPRKQEGGD